MTGLLYKDFIMACRIKKTNVAVILVIGTIIFAILRILFSTFFFGQEVTGLTDQGEEINLLDLNFVYFVTALIIIGMSTINSFISRIFEGDEKNKIKGYLNVMPIRKHDYVASKYIFIGIACYVFFSVEMIWSVICIGYCQEGNIKDFANLVSSFVLYSILLSLFMASIELPLFLKYGQEKATLAKAVVLVVIALVFIGYVLFGELLIFENMDIGKLIDWVNNHDTELMLFSAFSPVIIILIYYGSFKLSCKITERN